MYVYGTEILNEPLNYEREMCGCLEHIVGKSVAKWDIELQDT